MKLYDWFGFLGAAGVVEIPLYFESIYLTDIILSSKGLMLVKDEFVISGATSLM